jgi:hypothetical protein
MTISAFVVRDREVSVRILLGVDAFPGSVTEKVRGRLLPPEALIEGL